MGRKIELELDGKDYTIEFDREIFKKMDSIGVSVITAMEKPLTFVESAFKFGMRKHHPDLNSKKLDMLYNTWVDEYGFDNFGEFVIEEYNAFFSTTQSNSDKPKKTMKIIE